MASFRLASTSSDMRQEGTVSMMRPGVSDPRCACRGSVIALHCSGAGAGQWRSLAAALGSDYLLTAPEHYGTESSGPWAGEHTFMLTDEAARTVALIDRTPHQVHLVGHSYGGGVALRVAIERPSRIASLTLYEPSAFYILAAIGEVQAYAEIRAVVRACADGVITGDHQAAAARFIDYWNGAGAWDLLRPDIKAGLVRWLPKAVLDFHALLAEVTPLAAYSRLSFPVLLLRGEHAPTPTRLIAEELSRTFPRNRLMTIAGAGHMGPLTHAEEVNRAIVAHVEAAQSHVQLVEASIAA
jgi:pimeloyl-ACP methyl ester carboxylesterase